MNKLLRNLVLLGTIPFISGCEQRIQTRLELSDLMQENGQVVDTLYNQGYHDSKINLGITSNGEMSLTPTTVNVPETWGVVFRCGHGNKFAIQGSEDKHKILWEKLDPNTNVIIDYKEVRKNTYEDINGDGIRDLTNSVVVDYDFIDANPRR